MNKEYFLQTLDKVWEKVDEHTFANYNKAITKDGKPRFSGNSLLVD